MEKRGRGRKRQSEAHDMSESLSPPPEEQELEIQDTHVDDDDDGISTDTSSSLPGSPGAEDDGDVVTICRWDGCNQDLRTLDALVRHVHDCKRSFINPSLFRRLIFLSL